MKKTFLLFAIFLAMLSFGTNSRVSAQATAISLTDSIPSGTSFCTLPTNVYFNLYGTVSGALTTANDTVTIYFNAGDGFDTTFTVEPYSLSSGWYNTYIFHNYTLPGAYTTYATATAMSGVSATAPSTVYMSNTCANLHGRLYGDLNGNCVHDAGEPGLPYLNILAINTTTGDTAWGGYTDDSGNYAINLIADDYKIVPNLSTAYYWFGFYGGGLAPSCPASGTYTFTAAASGSYTENFAFSCTPPDSIDIVAGGFNCDLVRGATSWIQVYAGDWWWYSDYICADVTSTITLTLDPKLHYLDYVSYYGGSAPSSVSGSTVTWDLSSASGEFGLYGYVEVTVDSSATIGDTLCNTIYASPTSLPDPNLSNNTAAFCDPVLASYDPNGIAVAPQGVGAPGYIINETPLTYNIHFQNTGTAPATNITVEDTLSTNLDMSTLHVLKSSAPVEIYKSGNAVKFFFSNINLADSMDHPNQSIGSVTFGVMPKPDLAAGTQIFNKASIYFDYNSAVVTNRVLNTINNTLSIQNVSNNGVKAIIYPNPAGDEVSAKTDDKSEFIITVTDMLGRTIATSNSIKGQASISTSSLSAGLYLVTLTNSNGKQLTTKLTVQH
jgi:hypothetical protein